MLEKQTIWEIGKVVERDVFTTEGSLKSSPGVSVLNTYYSLLDYVLSCRYAYLTTLVDSGAQGRRILRER